MAKVFKWILTTLISLIIGFIFGAFSEALAVADDYDNYRAAKIFAAHFK